MATLGNSRNLHNPSLPPEPILKTNFPATYLRMMYKTSFYEFLSMHNPFMMFNFLFAESFWCCFEKSLSDARVKLN